MKAQDKGHEASLVLNVGGIVLNAMEYAIYTGIVGIALHYAGYLK